MAVQYASATAAGLPASADISATTETATATATAWGATVSLEALPEEAPSNATAHDASVIIQTRPATATATGTAYDATEGAAPSPVVPPVGRRRRRPEETPRDRVDVYPDPATATAAAHDATVRADDTERLLLELLGVLPHGVT